MLRRLPRQRVFALVFCCGLGVATSVQAVEPDAPSALFTRADAIKIQVSKLLGQKFHNTTEAHKEDHGALVEYYSDRSNDLVWVNESGLNDRAIAAMDVIRKAGEWGLRPQDYDLPSRYVDSTQSGAPVDSVAMLEVKMDYAVLAYARNASGGRLNPEDLSENLDFKPPYADPLKTIQKLSYTNDAQSFLLGLHPQHDQFLKLKKLLTQIRSGHRDEPDVVYIPDGETIRPGDTHPDVALIRQRLKVQTPAGVDEELYDEVVVDAVRGFQSSNGLRPDGLIGRRTRSAMNGDEVVPSNVEEQILANMERWRWLPRDLGRLHVNTNIPEFMVRIRKDNRVIFEERVVTGKITNKTPAFTDKMERVVFNPYWNPPRSIILNEIIPGAQRSSNFIRRQGLQIVNARGRVVDPYYIDWYSSQPLRYQFRQPPGRGNVLGVVKFMFPNKHSVYMHDTPSKSLFNHQVRTFSHGCMRVRNPRKMAEVIMGEVQGWSRNRIDDVIASGRNSPIELDRTIPVHVTYFTMWVDGDGSVSHFKDIYGHDKRTIAALEGRPMAKEVNRKYTAPRVIRRPKQQFPSFFEALFDD